MIEDYKKAIQDGLDNKNLGLPTGLSSLDKAINRVQRKTIYSVGGSPKAGKSSLVNFAFIYNPFLYALEHPDVNINIILYTLEMDRLKQKFRAATFFIYKEYGIMSFVDNNITYQGSHTIPFTTEYIQSKMVDDNGNPIKIRPEHQEMVEYVFNKYVNKLFGVHDENGKTITPGIVTMIEDRTDSNPTGIYKMLLLYAEKNGQFILEPYTTKNDFGKEITKTRITGYKPKDPELYTIIIIDHLRKLKIESRNNVRYTLKQNIDKMLEYEVILRNICGFTFVNIIHLNRGISDINRIRYMQDKLYPNNDDIKDTGNVSEDSDVILTLFNPHDDRYRLATHMGIDLAANPNYRSIHLIESRDTESPVHLQVEAYLGMSYFKPIGY